jgi:hypothetical protein
METIVFLIAAGTLFWAGMLTAVVWGGLIFVIAAAVLGGLKLISTIAWSRWWVMLSLWAAIGGAYVKVRMAARDLDFTLAGLSYKFLHRCGMDAAEPGDAA